MPKKIKDIIAVEEIVNKIIVLRGERVMLDRDIAEMYGVETKLLKRAVRRNIERFPHDFMFQLTAEEYRSLRRQFGTLKRGAHSKYPPNTASAAVKIEKSRGNIEAWGVVSLNLVNIVSEFPRKLNSNPCLPNLSS